MLENGKPYGEITSSLNSSKGNVIHYNNKNKTAKQVPHRRERVKGHQEKTNWLFANNERIRKERPRGIRTMIFTQIENAQAVDTLKGDRENRECLEVFPGKSCCSLIASKKKKSFGDRLKIPPLDNK